MHGRSVTSRTPLDDERAAEIAYARERSHWRIALMDRLGLDTSAEVAGHDRIVAPAIAVPALPAHLAKTIPAPSRERLEALLRELSSFAEGLVGLTGIEARVLYNGDDTVAVLRDEFHSWVRDHVRRRVARPAPRDRSDPLVKYCRVLLEGLEWISALCRPAANAVVLGPLDRRFAWEVWEHTLLPVVDLDPDTGLPCTAGLPEWRAAALREIDGHFDWHDVGEFRRFMVRVPGRVPAGPDAAGELSRLTADLVECKGLLMRDYDPLEHVVVTPQGLRAMWLWSHDGHAGELHCAEAAEPLREALQNGSVCPCSVRLGFDGLPYDWPRPWVPLDDADHLTWVLALLRPVHEALVTKWLHRFEDTSPLEDEAERVARACAVLGTLDRPDAARSDRQRVPAVRTVTLLAMLERRFDCEVRTGKGSEITVYRRGGRKYTLGHHRRNVHVPSNIVRALLRAVGIGIDEFLEVASR